MNKTKIGTNEFISIMAILMSLVALTIDAMLPALSHIGTSLQVENPNDAQLIISTIFFGMALGLMLYGPISDSYGRKKAIYIGVGIFVIGDLISLFSNSLNEMLAGRLLQGFGAASCRVVTLAMIRDKFEGPKMAKVMSLIMVFFIMVPALAPSVGQAILLVANWHAIFLFILFVGVSSVLWLHFRQPETLAIENRLPFSFSVILSGIKETLSNSLTRIYILTAGIMFGSFIGYLSTAQQMLQIQYELGNTFSIYFGCLALAIGFSSFVNSRLVMKFQMEALCLVALMAITVSSALFFLYAQSHSGHPSLAALLSYIGVTFFCFGILFGNFNTLAIQPLGHIAGIATSVISSVQTLISVVIGGIIGQYYDGTVLPLVFGFLVCGGTSLLCMFYAQRQGK